MDKGDRKVAKVDEEKKKSKVFGGNEAKLVDKEEEKDFCIFL